MKLFSSTSEAADRGQNEPTAALIAVAFMVAGLMLFAGYHYDVVNQGSERTADRPALNMVYDHSTESGQFHTDSPLVSVLEPQHLPRGQNIYVKVLWRDDSGELTTLDQAYFDEDGEYQAQHPNLGFPSNAQNASRPIAVQRPDGETHGGRLHVTVWE